MRVKPVGARTSGMAIGLPRRAGGVDLADITQYPRAEGHPPERRRVRGQSDFVFGCAVDVVEDTSGEATASDGTEVGNRYPFAEATLGRAQLEALESEQAKRSEPGFLLWLGLHRPTVLRPTPRYLV